MQQSNAEGRANGTNNDSTSRLPKRWTDEENRRLHQLHAQHLPPKLIAAQFPGRSSAACTNQWYKIRSAPPHPQYDSDEDVPLSQLSRIRSVTNSVSKPETTVADQLVEPAQPRLSRWSADEDKILLRSWNADLSWAAILAKVPGRTRSACTNRVYKLKRQSVDSESQQPDPKRQRAGGDFAEKPGSHQTAPPSQIQKNSEKGLSGVDDWEKGMIKALAQAGHGPDQIAALFPDRPNIKSSIRSVVGHMWGHGELSLSTSLQQQQQLDTMPIEDAPRAGFFAVQPPLAIMPAVEPSIEAASDTYAMSVAHSRSIGSPYPSFIKAEPRCDRSSATTPASMQSAETAARDHRLLDRMITPSERTPSFGGIYGPTAAHRTALDSKLSSTPTLTQPILIESDDSEEEAIQAAERELQVLEQANRRFEQANRRKIVQLRIKDAQARLEAHINDWDGGK